jgi:two-component sensor histidine kinase
MNSASDSFYLFDPDLNFVEINKKGLETMGMKKEGAIGKHMTEIIPDVKESGRFDKHLEVLRTGKPFVIEHYIPHPQFGDKHFILKSFKVGDGLGVIATDITERWKAEEKIKKSLEEKEVLINEIHHRVKNNMQIITSLLRIQASNITDEKIQDVFKALHDRIKSMSILYQMLYQSNDLTRVDLSEYIRNLTAHLVSMYRDRVGTIDLKLKVKDVYLDIKRTVPCGLIITELVSNSLKHAFSGVKKGEISVEMHPDGGEKYALAVRDSGKGFPEGLDYRETPSLGMKLVVDLVKQLEGTIELNSSKGTEFKIVF